MDGRIDTIKSWLGTGSINVFGRPFSGKDTQGEKLSELFDAPLIGGGEIMRSYHDQDHLERIMASGQLVPHDIYLKIVIPYLSREAYQSSPLILSAVGRSHGEGPVILRATRKASHPIKVVLFLDITDEEVWRRFEQSKKTHDRNDRADDSAEALKTRLQKFQSRTMPVIGFYRSMGLVVDVDGSLPREEVTESILEALVTLATSKQPHLV